VLVAAQAAMLGGFSLRYRVTGLVPLTNMFESVAFVAMSVALLGIWFALLPLFWPGLRLAWRLTALPLPWRTAAPSPEDAALLRPERWRPVQAALGVARLVLVGLTFCWLARLSPDSAFGYFDIALRLDSAATWSQNLNDAVVWAVGWCVLLLALYYLPRAALAAAVALCCTVPWTLAQRGLAEPMRQVGQRKVFALVGAVVCFLAAATAYYAPNRVINKEISTAAAVLRSNFWLFVHVLTICASYAAGALAWGLSNISLGYCLMGRYRPASGGGRPEPDYLPAGDEEPDEAAAAPPARLLPPEPCAALAQYTYKATQVAVVLLAAGTILGALWADKAWGRFWSWDAKEVWSLLTLFAYMAILHARHIGWVGNFGLAVGSVLGATFIVFAWYGVNFLLPQGLHSYGKSSGGQVQVAIVIVLNWLFAVAAGVRYQVMMNLPTAAEPAPTPPSRPRRAPQSGRGRG
jgi:ABC-type transport system involved in cytochrome c biogenesis permease subunit